MPTPDHILNKIKLLKNLGSSANENESASANSMAEKLITKYGVTEEELQALNEKPVEYSADSILFHTFSLVGWMQQLALACAKQFYCHVVQECITSATGYQEYNYYVYGDDHDVVCTKFAFATFLKKIHELVDTKCIGRGPVYIDSYTEGLVEGIRSSIALMGIEMPERVQPSRSPTPDGRTLNNGNSNLAKQEKELPKRPEKDSVDVNHGSMIKDVMAYFRGIEDGNRVSLQDVLELEAENEEARRLQEAAEEAAEEAPEYPTQQGPTETPQGGEDSGG